MGKTIAQSSIEEGEQRGMVRGFRSVLLRVVSQEFGPPDDATLATIEAIAKFERLELLMDRFVVAPSWDELLRTI